MAGVVPSMECLNPSSKLEEVDQCTIKPIGFPLVSLKEPFLSVKTYFIESGINEKFDLDDTDNNTSEAAQKVLASFSAVMSWFETDGLLDGTALVAWNSKRNNSRGSDWTHFNYLPNLFHVKMGLGIPLHRYESTSFQLNCFAEFDHRLFRNLKIHDLSIKQAWRRCHSARTCVLFSEWYIGSAGPCCNATDGQRLSSMGLEKCNILALCFTLHT